MSIAHVNLLLSNPSRTCTVYHSLFIYLIQSCVFIRRMLYSYGRTARLSHRNSRTEFVWMQLKFVTLLVSKEFRCQDNVKLIRKRSLCNPLAAGRDQTCHKHATNNRNKPSPYVVFICKNDYCPSMRGFQQAFNDLIKFSWLGFSGDFQWLGNAQTTCEDIIHFISEKPHFKDYWLCFW